MAKVPSKAAKKTTTKKAATKKVAAKKVAAKKVVVKKVATRKAAKKAATKKTVSRKPPARTTSKKTDAITTTVIAKVDAGFGNSVAIRGSGAGLSWEAGVVMSNASADEWVWQSSDVTEELEFKVLLNDNNWSAGRNGVVFPGATVVFEPTFG